MKMKLQVLLTMLLVLPLGCREPEASDNGQTSTPSAGEKEASGFRLSPKTVGGENLSPKKPIPGLEILIPDSFQEMDEATLVAKYPNANRPSLVYTDESGAVNVAINHTENAIAPGQLTQLHQQLDTSVRQAQPQANWMFSGFQHYHGKKWVQLEFQSQAVDTTVHNMMIATSAQGRMLAISFNCTQEQSEKWLNIGREIIKSASVEE